MPASIDRAAIDRVIRKHLARLRKPGVLTVRPGFELAHGRISGRAAIVVTVDRKRARVPARERLPEEIDGLPVDVREATGMQRLRRDNPTAHALAVRHARPEEQEPEWPYERRVSDGKRVSARPASTHPAARAVDRKPQIPYTPATPPLVAVTRPMTLIACASPDAGFSVLAGFLAGVRERLTVGLYDFTSAGILHALESALGTSRSLQMVLDHPPLNPTANESDDETVRALRRADDRSRQVWALSRSSPRSRKWIFPSAYHIKVAVRDGTALWLSSGNWNVSNQPDLAVQSPAAGSLGNADRDWHVILMDEGLARVFEAYIAHDFQVAASAQAPRNAALERSIDAAVRALALKRRRAAPAAGSSHATPFTLGRPRTFERAQVTIQPLLTPDRGRHTTMYVDNVLALLQSAKRSIYVQMQYVYPSALPGDRDFMRLVDALADAVRRGLDVRLITSQYENTPQYVEQLHEAGLAGVLRVQERVHNKGIVVDSRTVLVSSQNWSASGTLRNRDAGVIIHHPEVAAFFEAIFIEDWEQRATDRVVTPAAASAPRATRGSGAS
jgi:hypothetical protein